MDAESRSGIFATTHWSVVLTAGGASVEANDALERLCCTYWYPLYAYLRRRGHSEHTRAEKLTDELNHLFLCLSIVACSLGRCGSSVGPQAASRASAHMKRRHLIEIEDQSWCPCTIRNAATDYLQFCLATTKPYTPMVPILAKALERAGTRRILDLCSGGAGPWLWLQPALADMEMPVTVCLSDKYPNLEAFERSSRASNGAITYHPHPVDATRVSDEPPAFRTMFTAFHHFTPSQGRAVLADAVLHRHAIGIFEATERRALALLLMLLAPLAVLVVTPWIRPFRWSRLLWTYLVPVVPMVTLFDGLVSCLRTYSVQELRELIAGLDKNDYHWEVGTVRSRRSLTPISYLIGVPIENAA